MKVCPTLLAVVLAAASLGVQAVRAGSIQAARAGTSTAAPSIYRAILPALHRTGVPALLPTAGIPKGRYAALGVSSKGQYEIIIGYVPGCNGHACEWGTLDANKLGAHPHRPAGRSVSLTRGVTGYWLPFTCGANCDDSTITFDRGGYRYTYGVKAGKMKEVLPLANSALRAGPA